MNEKYYTIVEKQSQTSWMLYDIDNSKSVQRITTIYNNENINWNIISDSKIPILPARVPFFWLQSGMIGTVENEIFILYADERVVMELKSSRKYPLKLDDISSIINKDTYLQSNKKTIDFTIEINKTGERFVRKLDDSLILNILSDLSKKFKENVIKTEIVSLEVPSEIKVLPVLPETKVLPIPPEIPHEIKVLPVPPETKVLPIPPEISPETKVLPVPAETKVLPVPAVIQPEINVLPISPPTPLIETGKNLLFLVDDDGPRFKVVDKMNTIDVKELYGLIDDVILSQKKKIGDMKTLHISIENDPMPEKTYKLQESVMEAVIDFLMLAFPPYAIQPYK